MRLMKRHAIALMVLFSLMVTGVPGSASVNEVGTMTGTAEIGKTFWTGNDCDKTGSAVVVGRGLYFPRTPADDVRENQGAWHVRADLTTPGQPNKVWEACGWLGPLDGTRNYNLQDPGRTDGIGPSCLESKGHHGMGEIRQGGTALMKLMHLRWKTTVGATVTIMGQYQEYVGGNPANKGKKGTFSAPLTFAGGAACLNPDGLQSATFTGTYNLVNAAPDIHAPKLQHKKCKEPDPDQDKAKDVDPANSDPDWKRNCPTGKK